MVLRESNPDTSMKGVMYRALRERRKEIEVWRMQKDMVPEGAKMAKNSALGKVDHYGTGSGAGGRNDTQGGQTRAHTGSGLSGYMPTKTQGASGDRGQGQLDQFISLI